MGFESGGGVGIIYEPVAFAGGVPLANLRPKMGINPKMGFILKLRRVPNWDCLSQNGIIQAHEDPKRPMVAYGNVWQCNVWQCIVW